MRCQFCGSKNIAFVTKNEGYSVAKGIAGQLLFGQVGAVVGINGKRKQTYSCSACGQDQTIPMEDGIEASIDRALFINDISKLKMYKKAL